MAKCERINHAFFPIKMFDDFWADFDFHFQGGGFGVDITEWPKNPDFFGYSYFRFYYPVKGRFTLLAGDRSVEVVPGKLYLIPPFISLKFVSETPSTHYWFHFISHKLAAMSKAGRPYELAIPQNGQIAQRIRRLYSLVSQSKNSLAQALEIRQMQEKLLLPFLERFDFFHGQPDAADERINGFDRIQPLIEGRLTEELKVTDLAAQFHMSRQDFSARFLSKFGVSPKQYIIRRRLSLAQSLLCGTDLKIKEVAERSGYDDPYFFSRLFVKYYNMPPAAFRKKVREVGLVGMAADLPFC